MPAAIAAETDRLVWAVSDRVRVQHRNGELEGLNLVSPLVLGRLLNLIPFMYQPIDEAFVRRRYIYAPADKLTTFLDSMTQSGYVESVGGRLRPTAHFEPVRCAFDAAICDSARWHWEKHLDLVTAASVPARQVLDAGSDVDGLLAAAQAAPEPDDDCQRLYQRLAGLRLLRNEAHVKAWRRHNLYPGELEVLSHAWAGSLIQTPTEPTDLMVEQGLVVDGVVSQKGLDLRQEIEDETNAAVAEAFAAVDQPELLDTLRLLPGSTQEPH